MHGVDPISRRQVVPEQCGPGLRLRRPWMEEVPFDMSYMERSYRGGVGGGERVSGISEPSAVC